MNGSARAIRRTREKGIAGKNSFADERVHIGEFLKLLRGLAPDEEKFYAKGTGEVEKEIAKMK